MSFELKNISQTNNPKSKQKSFLQREVDILPWKFTDTKKLDFYREMQLLTQAGLDIRASISLIREEQKKKKDLDFFQKLEQAIVGGKQLSEAMLEADKFSPYEYQNIKIGEESGKINEVLLELRDYFNSKIDLRKQFVKVLAYPILIFSISLGVIFFMLRFVVPLFEDVFNRFDADLPTLTQGIIDLSKWLTLHWKHLFLFIIAVTILFISQRKKAWFLKQKSKWSLKIPIFGKLIQKVYLSRFCQSMNLLTRSNVPLVSALSLSKKMVEDYTLMNAIDQIEKEVIQGISLREAMSKHSIFESKMVSLIRVAEEVNKLDDMFETLKIQYKKDIDHQSAIIGSLLEPLMILFIAVFVGIILISMYLPLFEMNQIIK